VVVDTSVLIAGISGFRLPFLSGRNSSADLLHTWAQKNHIVWLTTEEILDEYKEVMKRLRIRPSLAGTIVNLIRQRAEEIEIRAVREISPDPKDDAFCLCAQIGKADFIITWNPKDFPEKQLNAKVLSPDSFAQQS
jgi:putative PIN family toxin of toxin-antitoxin system